MRLDDAINKIKKSGVKRLVIKFLDSAPPEEVYSRHELAELLRCPVSAVKGALDNLRTREDFNKKYVLKWANALYLGSPQAIEALKKKLKEELGIEYDETEGAIRRHRRTKRKSS